MPRSRQPPDVGAVPENREGPVQVRVDRFGAQRGGEPPSARTRTFRVDVHYRCGHLIINLTLLYQSRNGFRLLGTLTISNKVVACGSE